MFLEFLKTDNRSMVPNLDTEIQTTFSDEMHRALVNVMFTSNKIEKAHKPILSKYDLTIQQFNILRILRGQNGKPVTLKLITSRMFSPMSNTSRLVDKLLAKKWVAREQSTVDRRTVKIYITKTGLDQVLKAKNEFDNFVQERNTMDPEKLKTLNETCDLLRSIL